MADFRALVKEKSLSEIAVKYPVARDFLINLNLGGLDKSLPLAKALNCLDDDMLHNLEVSRENLPDQFAQFLENMLSKETAHKVHAITIIGGFDKYGIPENAYLTIHAGEIISIVGPTGSGKSRLLNDIECLAQEDTPTKRQILVNGKPLCDEERFDFDSKLVAQISQNMNFIMDLSVGEFLELHAKSRLCENPAQVIEQCFKCANDLSGEKFTLTTKVTQLSGGQSRALMIADTAYLSSSPIVLIDEIENAGIDWKKAISLLASNEKIVIISTHDALLALGADKRIVIKNGGIHKILKTTPEEQSSLLQIDSLTDALMDIRNRLRNGERIVLHDLEKPIGRRGGQSDEWLAVIR
jgi:ABC-type antimicrobial peptide transport system, ATPase component